MKERSEEEDTEMARIISHDELIAAEEAAVVDAQFVIHNLMEDAGISRADLARELGVSAARVTQMFSDEANNLTLRTLGRIFCVLGHETRITCDRWEALRTECDQEVEAEPPSDRDAAFDFASMLEAVDDLESASLDAYSNDNFQREAVAA